MMSKSWYGKFIFAINRDFFFSCKMPFLGFNTHMDLRVQLDKKSLPFEAQFANLGPVECVDLGVTLRKRSKC